MGGFFGVVSKSDCVASLYYGTDYHCHLGTRRGGLAVSDEKRFTRVIHDITNAQFRSKFDSDIKNMAGKLGIGVISDYEDQPLIIGSHFGTYALVTVGKIRNSVDLAQKAFCKRSVHFSEMSGNEINQTELVATIINQEESYAAGIHRVQEVIEGSCSLLILTNDCIYAARDTFGRTPVIVAKSPDGYAVTNESCAFPNLGYIHLRDLGPGEITKITPDGIETLKKPNSLLQICSFLWIYYGYPASTYEGINVEAARYRCGAALADRDSVEIDYACGIPDSGIAHAIGYSTRRGIPYRRPFVKYTPTWPRSFMPQQQSTRDLVAKMKLIPIKELTAGARLLFCDDSIVRGTQLKDTLQRMYQYGAREVHMRPACPPLLFGCKYLNFSRSKSEYDLIGLKAVRELEGKDDTDLREYCNPSSGKYRAMVERIKSKLSVDTLQYQRLDDMVKAIGLPKQSLCTYCWDGCEGSSQQLSLL
jgi:amidophosphoribosyltransferase